MRVNLSGNRIGRVLEDSNRPGSASNCGEDFNAKSLSCWIRAEHPAGRTFASQHDGTVGSRRGGGCKDSASEGMGESMTWTFRCATFGKIDAVMEVMMQAIRMFISTQSCRAQFSFGGAAGPAFPHEPERRRCQASKGRVLHAAS